MEQPKVDGQETRRRNLSAAVLLALVTLVGVSVLATEGSEPPAVVPALATRERIQTSAGHVEAVWQAPSRAVAVLLLAHGCSHSATDFFPASAGCPACTGLPEEALISAAALRAGFLVVAVSSENRETKCWSPEVDGPRVSAVLKKLLAGKEEKPLYALGASSGGAFVAHLPDYEPRVAALEVQIMAASFASLRRPFPPSRWVHMPVDAGMASGVTAVVAALRLENRPVEEVQLSPQPVTPAFLRARIPALGGAAETVVAALRGADLLDKRGFLVSDPRGRVGAAWRAALKGLDVGGDSLEADSSPLAEVLNVAWARHEISSERIEETLAFFRKHPSA